MDVRRPAGEEGAESEIICSRCVPELDQDRGGVVFHEDLEAAFCGQWHLALDGLVVDVDDSAGEGCPSRARTQVADADFLVVMLWRPLA